MTKPNFFLIFAIFLVACFVVAGMVGDPEWIQSSRKSTPIRARYTGKSERVRHLRKCAEEGDIDAMKELMAIYEVGEGVHKNDEEAAKWQCRLARRGCASAQLNIGMRYVVGPGVPRNLRKAYIWFSIAKKNGEECGKEIWDIVVSHLSDEEQSSAQEEADRLHKEISSC